MKEQTRFHCEICDKRINLTSRFENKLEFLSKTDSFEWKQTRFHCEMCEKRFNLTSRFENKTWILIKNHCFEWKSKQDSIVRYVTKDSISHLDLKTSLEFLSKTDSFEWKQTRFHCEICEQRFNLTLRFKNKTWILF